MNSIDPSLNDLRKHLQDQIYALDQSAIVAITDPRGVITYVNPMFCELSQYSEKELIGQTHSLINSGHHEKSFFVDMWQTITRGGVWRGEVCNRAKDSSLYWVDTTIVPMLDEAQRVQRYIAIRHDITAKKKAEEKIRKDRKLLLENEKMASMGVLAAGIAHELGNPLGAIRGRLEMLESMFKQDNFEKEFAIQSVDKMIANVDRMSKILRGLKSSSRDGRNDQMQLFDLTQLLGDILELSHQHCRKHEVTLETKGLDEPAVVMGRETDIGQVIVNLFNNAFDAVKDLDNPKIKIELHKHPESVQVLVIDSGPGIPDEIKSKIFDPFFTTKEVGQGTGLGLSISHSFIESHGGKLSYDRSSGNSTFTMELPLKAIKDRL